MQHSLGKIFKEQLTNNRQTAVPFAAALLLCLALCFPSWAAPAGAGEDRFILTERSLDNLRKEGLPYQILEKLEAIKDQKFDSEDEFLEAVRQEIGNDQTVHYKEQILKHAADEIAAEINRITDALQAQKLVIDALMAQNSALEMRLAELEATRDERAQKQAEAESRKEKELEQRIKELEDAQIVREDATRLIIRDALSTLGSKINESVALGGTLEVAGGWTKDFFGHSEGLFGLTTAELDLEIDVNEWTKGNFVIEYVDGKNVIFQTTSGFETGVDRINLARAYMTIGDPQRFPPFMTAGRIILPFGISTGSPVADVLTIEDPLTIEAFEMRKTAIGIGLGFPTPALTPVTLPVTPPPVRPLVLNPLISSISRGLGLKPLPPQPLTPITPTPTPPLFNVGVYAFDGDTFEGVERTGGFRPGDHFGATLGFRTNGNCGRPFDQLRGSAFCPWSIDVDVDYSSSIFDSRFLGSEYWNFLDQIGFVHGMAGSVKATLGPMSLVGEWNGALCWATFTDYLNRKIRIKPSAWQISLGYQFDWNPWVEAIGAQGDYIAISYSQSRGLAGVSHMIGGVDTSVGFVPITTRVGFVPKRRLIVSVGEWILPNVKFAIEYSYNEDYPRTVGGTGTGNRTDGVFSQLTAVW